MPTADLKAMPAREMIPGGKVRIVHSHNMTFAYWEFEPEVILPEHAHPHEQVLNLVDGTLEFTLAEGETLTYPAGTVIIIPSNLKHKGKTITKCTIIDVFYPKREDLG